MFRPEHVQLAYNGHAQFQARVDSVFFLGNKLRIQLIHGQVPILMEGKPDLNLKTSQEVGLRIPAEALHVWERREI